MQRPGKAASSQPPSKQEKGGEDSKMAPSQSWERRIVIGNIIKSYIGMALVFAGLYVYVPIPTPSLPTMMHRLVYTLRWQTPSFFFIGLSVMNVGMIRLFTTALDPINGGGERYVLFAGRVLTSTVEQTLFNVPAQLVLATFLREDQMKVIPILVMIFAFGRISFYIGYRISYLKRTVGFISTFVVSLHIWLVNAYFVGKAVYENQPLNL